MFHLRNDKPKDTSKAQRYVCNNSLRFLILFNDLKTVPICQVYMVDRYFIFFNVVEYILLPLINLQLSFFLYTYFFRLRLGEKKCAFGSLSDKNS